MSSNYTTPQGRIIENTVTHLATDEPVIEAARLAMHDVDFSDLMDVLSFTSLRGLSIPDALQVARTAHKEARTSYCAWAMSRHNEDAFRKARRRLIVAARAVEVLEMALAAFAAAQQQAVTEAEAPASTRVAPFSYADDPRWKAQNKRLRAVMRECGVPESKPERLAFASMYLNLAPIESFRELTAEQVGRIADAVHRGEVTCDWQFRELIADAA
jgi:hypothetical protein